MAPIGVEQQRGLIPAAPRREPADDPIAPSLQVIHEYSRACKSVDLCTAAHLRAAIEHFDSALRYDPDYTLGLVGLARTRLLLAQNGYSSGSNEFPKAKDAVIHALQIEPGSAQAHALLSSIILLCDWNPRDARRELDAAVRLSPNSATVRSSAALLYAWTGQSENALLEARRAVTMEPASPGLQLLLGRTLIGHGNYVEAIGHLSDVMETHPEHASTARRYRIEALLLNRQPADAMLDLLLLPQDRAEDLASRLPLLAMAYADNGDVEKAQDVYETLLLAKQTDHVPFTTLVPVALALGHRSQALEHFERSLKLREPVLPVLRHSPWLSTIRKSDIFRSLLTAIDPA